MSRSLSDGPRVVAFGGGHGLAASLAALRRVTSNLTAVVTVADDGGSSGRLREQLGCLPPGDLRMALAALAADDEWGQTWAALSQHRFSTGELAGHAVGNLLITGLIETTGDVVSALDLVGRLLGATGRVLPMSAEPLQIVADVTGLDPVDEGAAVEVRGQHEVAITPGHVVSVRLEPAEPQACPAAVEAVLAADWVVLGPGSWFTSVLPHLLVPDIAKALATSRARKVVALNLAPQPGETDGFRPETHLEVLAAHAPQLEIDVVLADPLTIEVGGEARLREVTDALGAVLAVAHVAMDDGSPRHDPQRLASAYHDIFTTFKGGSAWR